MTSAPTDRMIQSAIDAVSDESIDFALRKATLRSILTDDGPAADAVARQLLGSLGAANARSVYRKKAKELAENIKRLEEGPVRKATFIALLPAASEGASRRAEVVLENGDTAYPLVLDKNLAGELMLGDDVLMDWQARTILQRHEGGHRPGELAELVGVCGNDLVEVELRDHTSELFLVSNALKEQLETGEAQPGCRLVVCQRRRFAFGVAPPREGVSTFRYLDNDPIPEIDVDRDIGCPPEFIHELLQHLRRQMVDPDLPRKYRQRPMQTRLLTGVTGSGKTLSINGFIAGVYKLISEITGAPVETIPRRVLRLRTPQILSQWLGVSDKNLDRFFDEAVQLEQTHFIGPDGREWTLPVICCCEEIDAIARARGSHDSVYDRIQTTALERLDHLSKGMGDRLIVLLFTTNIVESCDTAFIRRAGGEIIRFGRIGRGAFTAILGKHLAGLPIRSDHGEGKEGEQRLCRDATNWMFSENGHDPGQLEVTLAGSGTPIVKRRRDLLTPAVVDLSVQQVAKEACRLEEQGVSAGITSEMLITAFDKQVQSIRDRVNQFNAHEYLTLPEGTRVASVTRIQQSSVQRFEVDRRLT